jgi:hypothetical protein
VKFKIICGGAAKFDPAGRLLHVSPHEDAMERRF